LRSSSQRFTRPGLGGPRDKGARSKTLDQQAPTHLSQPKQKQENKRESFPVTEPSFLPALPSRNGIPRSGRADSRAAVLLLPGERNALTAEPRQVPLSQRDLALQREEGPLGEP